MHQFLQYASPDLVVLLHEEEALCILLDSIWGDDYESVGLIAPGRYSDDPESYEFIRQLKETWYKLSKLDRDFLSEEIVARKDFQTEMVHGEWSMVWQYAVEQFLCGDEDSWPKYLPNGPETPGYSFIAEKIEDILERLIELWELDGEVEGEVY